LPWTRSHKDNKSWNRYLPQLSWDGVLSMKWLVGGWSPTFPQHEWVVPALVI
jgi:hypothetical protein